MFWAAEVRLADTVAMKPIPARTSMTAMARTYPRIGKTGLIMLSEADMAWFPTLLTTDREVFVFDKVFKFFGVVTLRKCSPQKIFK